MSALGVTCKEAFHIFSENLTLSLQKENTEMSHKLSKHEVRPQHQMSWEEWDHLWSNPSSELWNCASAIEDWLVLPAEVYIASHLKLKIKHRIKYFLDLITKHEEREWSDNHSEEAAEMLDEAFSHACCSLKTLSRIHLIEFVFLPWVRNILRSRLVLAPKPEGYDERELEVIVVRW